MFVGCSFFGGSTFGGEMNRVCWTESLACGFGGSGLAGGVSLTGGCFG